MSNFFLRIADGFTDFYRRLEAGFKKSNLPANMNKSIGASGTKIQGYQLDEEPSGEFSDLENRFNLMRQMLYEEPACSLTQKAWRDPLLSAEFNIENPDLDRSGKEIPEEEKEKIQKFIYANLFENPITPWTKWLENWLQMIMFGVSVNEFTLEQRDGQYWLQDIEYRHMRTIRWVFDEEDHLAGVEQVNVQGNKQPEGMIPIEKILLFTSGQIGNNVEGIGILRYQYRAWKMKRNMLQKLMIGYEKFLVTTPFFKAPKATTGSNEWKEVKEILKFWRSHEKGGGIIPDGWDLQIPNISFTGAMSGIKYVELLEREMFLAGMTQGFLMGLNKVGSFALRNADNDIFMLALKGYLKIVCDTINYKLIPLLVDLNFTTSWYPRLTANVLKEDAAKKFEMIINAAKTHLIPTTPGLAKVMVEWLGLPPEVTEEVKEEQKNVEDEIDDKPPEKHPEEKGDVEDEEPGEGAGVEKRESSASPPFWRELTAAEEQAGGIKALVQKKDFLDGQEQNFDRVIRPEIKRMTDDYIKAVKKNGADKALDHKFDISKLAAKITKLIETSALEGIRQVEQETKRTVPNETKTRVKAWAVVKGTILAKRQAENIKFGVSNRASHDGLKPEEFGERFYTQNVIQGYKAILEVFQKVGQ